MDNDMSFVTSQMIGSGPHAGYESFSCLSSKIISRLGYEACTYAIQMPLPISAPQTFIFNDPANTPYEWHEKLSYVDMHHLLRLGLTTAEPMILDKAMLEKSPFLQSIVADRKESWMHVSRSANGAMGVFIIGGNQPNKQFGLIAKKNIIAWTSQRIHSEIAQLLMRRFVPEASANITQREKEVLRWTADGKTTSEIAQILTLTGTTVNFHLKNATMKLDAANKTQAAIKAVTLGILL
jgi:DNA-binding CsgD family transcriptional regulator